MIKGRNVRQLIKEAGPNFRRKFREMLGVETVTNMNGTFARKYNRNKAQIGADEFSLRDLAEEFFGQSYVENLHNQTLGEGDESAIANGLREDVNPVLPSAFADINAFNQSVGGLVEVRLLAGYESPDFIGEQLVETQPTRVNGGKLIGIPRVQGLNEETLPGEEYPSVGLRERWAIKQPNRKYGGKIALTKESVVYDLTGDLLASAEGLGYSLALGKEANIAAAVMGINLGKGTSVMYPPGYNGVSYIYDGQPSDTPNATYQTTAGTGTSAKYNFANELTTNYLEDWTNLQSCMATLNLATEWETGFRILATLDQIIVSPQVLWNARNIVHATTVLPSNLLVTGSGGGAAPSTNFPTGLTQSMNPVPSLPIFSSPIWNKLLTDYGTSQTNADKIWFGGNFRKAFIWAEVWPLNIVQVNPSSSNLVEKDVVNEWVCNWYGTPAVRDPRYVVKNGG